MNQHRPNGAEIRLLNVSGLQIATRVQGEGDPLLLINGMTRPLQSWEPFTAALSRRTIVSFDLPGVGGSPTSLLPLSIPALAAIAAQVLDAAGLHDADVLGYSHGGAIAQHLAGNAADRVRRLVLAATSCGVGATPGPGLAGLRGLGRPANGNASSYVDPRALWWHSIAFSSWSSIPFLGAIKAPTLVVCGTRDRFVPPANSRVLAGRIPDARLVLLPAGHDLQRPESATALARLVGEFLPAWRGTEPAAYSA